MGNLFFSLSGSFSVLLYLLCSEISLYYRDWETTIGGPDLSHHLFWYSPWAKNGFTFLDLKTKSKEEYFAMWKWSEVNISVSIIKILLEHSHIHLLTYYGYFHTTVAELSNCDRGPAKPKIFTTWPEKICWFLFLCIFLFV